MSLSPQSPTNVIKAVYVLITGNMGYFIIIREAGLIITRPTFSFGQLPSYIDVLFESTSTELNDNYVSQILEEVGRLWRLALTRITLY